MNYEYFSKMPHEITELDIWLKKPFDKAHALADLILASCDYTKGKYEKGCVYRSQRWLASRWGWDKKTVDKFLADLEDIGVLTTKRTNKGTTVFLVGKAKTPNSGVTERTTKRTHSRIKNKGGVGLDSPLPPEEWEDWE